MVILEVQLVSNTVQRTTRRCLSTDFEKGVKAKSLILREKRHFYIFRLRVPCDINHTQRSRTKRMCNWNAHKIVQSTFLKIQRKYSNNSFQVDMKMDCCKRKEKLKKGGASKSFLTVKLDVHMTNFKGCQNKKGGEESCGKNKFTS